MRRPRLDRRLERWYLYSWGLSFAIISKLTAGDFQEFLGDIALTQLVVFERQIMDQRGRIVRGARHGHHPGALFAGLGFQQNPVDKNVEVMSEEVGEDRLRTWIEEDVGCIGGRAASDSAPGIFSPLISPIGRNSTTAVRWDSVLTNSVTTIFTSSTSPFKNRSRPKSAIGRDSSNRGESPNGNSAANRRRVRAINCAASLPTVMNTVVAGSNCAATRNKIGV